MAYNTKELLQKALSIADEKNVFFIEDIICLLPCSKPTFYEHFSIDSNEFNAIKDKIERNKVDKKIEIRSKLSEGNKASELIALYKLIGTDEERKKLSQNYTDITTGGKSLLEEQINLNINFKDFS